jgi:hypothetical protein
VPCTGDRKLWIGEHDGERCAPVSRPHVGVASGVPAGDPALVGRLVQQRQIVARVAGNEHRMTAALHRCPVV